MEKIMHGTLSIYQEKRKRQTQNILEQQPNGVDGAYNRTFDGTGGRTSTMQTCYSQYGKPSDRGRLKTRQG